MGVVLPDKLAFVLDLIGVNWPNVDEDDYREMAKSLRGFATDVDAGRGDSNVALNRLISTNRGEMTQAIEGHVRKLNGKHLHNLAEAGRLLAGGLDAAAVVVAGAKGAAIVQLGILAAEVATAQAAAPFTLGLSELGALGGVAVTRTVVKRILKGAAEAAVQEVMSVVTGPVFAALDSMTTDLVVQVVSDGLGAQDGINLKQTLQAGKDNLKIASAGGAGGAGGAYGGGGGGGLILASADGSGGGGGDLVFDEYEHNTFTGKVHEHSKHLDEKGGKHLHASLHHFGRTRGRGSLAKAIEEVTEKAMKSLGDAHGQLKKHLNDVGDGLSEAGKAQKKHDKHVQDSMDGVKNRHPDQKTAHGSGGGSGHGGNGSGGSGGQGNGSSGDGDRGRPMDPSPDWHGRTAKETRHHRGEPLDVAHLSPEQQSKELSRESKDLADKATESVQWPGGQVPPGKAKMPSGCAGAFLHNGVITSHTSFQQKKVSQDLPEDKRAIARAAQTPDVHPVLGKMYDDVLNSGGPTGVGHGKCAEMSLVSDRLHQMDPTGKSIRTPEDARKVLEGGIMETRVIGKQRHPDTGEVLTHGMHQPACMSCRQVLPKLGIIGRSG
ncbi:YwqJ-related putative deaminase [Streptomyces sp. NPDC021100]|uniref:YwqJ-related putative deaminase n=1 Tax=Streptomyces sp. NPDC021100 TaxID=3365114 RepID=UPI003787E8F5